MEDSELMAYRGGNLSNELLYMINYTYYYLGPNWKSPRNFL